MVTLQSFSVSPTTITNQCNQIKIGAKMLEIAPIYTYVQKPLADWLAAPSFCFGRIKCRKVACACLQLSKNPHRNPDFIQKWQDAYEAMRDQQAIKSLVKVD